MATHVTYTAEQLASEKRHILREYKKLLSIVQSKIDTEEDRRTIHRAFKLAADAHSEMRRTSGEPYILHPIEVAKICVQEIGLGVRSVVCALLHDVVEDTNITLEDIRAKFGSEIAKIIDGLTKIEVASTSYTEEVSKQAENFKRIVLSIVDDPRIIFIKLADRLHNMRTLHAVPRNKQLKISSETMYIYAPLAHRLGFNSIKTEMEDLSLKFAHPEEYANIDNKMEETKMQRTRFIAHFAKPIREQLDADGEIDYHISGRTKSIYSIWNKMKKKAITFEEVLDQFAIRIIIRGCKTEKEEIDKCWKVYSIVSNLYHPIPNRLRDWLSVPKNNGYKALHLTVMTAKGRAVEVQIRTEKMNEIAEHGMAAHWKYKESASKENIFDMWVNRIKQTFSDTFDANSVEFLIDFKNDFLSDEIYVFTHKGDTKILPFNATVLDFAYSIHSDVGNTCFAAKVNSKLVPIHHTLQSGDKVEIITSSKQNPKPDWLNFVISSKAKSKIKEAMNAEKRRLAEEGKDTLFRKCRTWKVNIDDKLIGHLQKKTKFSSLTDFYAQIQKDDHFINVIKQHIEDFFGWSAPAKPATESTANKPAPSTPPPSKIVTSLDKNAVEIFDQVDDKLLYTFAPCCQPIPGDEIFGFISRNPSEGIRIHKTDCKNAPYLFANYAYRIVKTRWASQISQLFETIITLRGVDTMGLINELTQEISSNLHLNIVAMNIESKQGEFIGKIRLFVKDKQQLDKLLLFFNHHPSISSVEREDGEYETP